MRSKSFPLVLVIVGGFAVILGSQIESTGFGESSDIGPKAFPILMGTLLILGGVYEFLKLFRSRTAKNAESLDFLNDAEPIKKSWKFWPILMGIIIYLIAVPIAGFIASTVIFTFLMMKSLGTKWIASMVSALAIAFVVYGMFVLLFKVQLPGGLLFG